MSSISFPKKYVLIQTAIGDYRCEFMRLLRARLGDRLEVHVGEQYFYSSLQTRLPPGFRFKRLRNVFFLRRKLLIQFGAVIPGIAADVAVLELNPRILTVWLTLFFRKVLRRRTVLWGHAWPRAGSEAKTDLVRALMRKSADAVLVYTECQAMELRKKQPRTSVLVAPNALYSKEQMVVVPPGERRDFVYVGRMVLDKKVDLLLDAFGDFANEVSGVCLHLVGEGPISGSLADRALKLGISKRVLFYGHEADVNQLRKIYSRCVAAISPGYVGLSITQAFGFGVPMIVADHEPHAPEIEAAVKGFNTVFFKAGHVSSLRAAMMHLHSEKHRWISRATEISERCKTQYSAEIMAERFEAALVGGVNDQPLS